MDCRPRVSLPRLASFTAASLLVACNSSTKPPSNSEVDGGVDAAPDARPDAPPFLTQVVVRVFTAGDVPLIAFRDGSGPWQALPSDGSEQYAIDVSGPYTFVIVCKHDTTTRTAILMAAPQDVEPYAFCFAGSEVDLPTVQVTGRMMQPGNLSLYDDDASDTAPWNFALEVPLGKHDLFAWDADRMLLQRDLVIMAAGPLPDVTLAGADPFTLVPVILANVAADETVGSSASLYTESGGFYATFGGPARLHRVPASVLAIGDYEYQSIYASSPSSSRGIDYEDADIPSDPVTVSLMPRIDTLVTWDPEGPSWTSLPEFSTMQYSRSAFGATRKSVEVTASKNYIGSARELEIDLAIPGYDDAWKLPPSGTSGYMALRDAFGRSTAAWEP